MSGLKSAWSKFWGLRWRWKGSIIGVAVIVIIAIATSAGGGSSNKDNTPATVAVAAVKSSTAKPNTPTAAPTKIVATATTAPPKPTATPASFEAQLLKSYQDNRDFMSRAVGSPVKVTWDASTATATFDVYPSTILNEADALTIAGASAIVANKAVWSTYPQVGTIVTNAWIDVTDSTGATTKQNVVSSTVVRATGTKFVYSGLKDRAAQDNKLWFCGADAYQLDAVIYLKIKDLGCMAPWQASKPLGG